jgi:hypothetical protein
MLTDQRTHFAGLRTQIAQIRSTVLLERFRGKGMPRHAHEKSEADRNNETEKFLSVLAH